MKRNWIHGAIILSVLIVIIGCMSVCSFADDIPDGYIGIYTKEDLNNMRKDLEGKYILMNDINFSPSDFASGGDFYNSGKGWSPIGSFANAEKNFKGVFDGNGHVISGLYINYSQDGYPVGLFDIANGSTICNLILDNVNISGAYFTGGICGRAIGITNIYNCIVTGSVCSSGNSAGGIAGNVFGRVIIDNCRNSAFVSSQGSGGGIVGGAYYGVESNQIIISNCSNSGMVTCPNISKSTSIGGIIGYSEYVTIENCYNRGYIYCSKTDLSDNTISCCVGGIIGNRNKKTVLTCCYNSGTVEGSNIHYIGGIAGKSVGSEPTTLFYLDTSVSEPTCTLGTAKTTDDFKDLSTFVDWGFDTVWTMEGLSDYPYPELCSQVLHGNLIITGNAGWGEIVSGDPSGLIGFKEDNCMFQWIIDGNVLLESAGAIEDFQIPETAFGKSLQFVCNSSDPFRPGVVSTNVTVTKALQKSSAVLAVADEVTDHSISFIPAEGQEYSIDCNNWISADVISGLDPNNEYTVYTRIAEKDLYFAGDPVICFAVTTERKAISGTIAVIGVAEYNTVLTMDASGIVPDDASYSVEWTVDGNTVSGEKTYTTVAEDIGKTVVVTVNGTGDYSGNLSAESDQIEAKSLSTVSLSNIDDIMIQTYTTQPVEPVPVLKDGDQTLTKDVDYTVAYEDNLDSGTAHIIINGTGLYRGQRKPWFTIVAMDVDYKVECDPIAAVTYTGNEHKPVPSLHYNGYDLVEGVDFSCEYSDNINPGTAHITVKGISNNYEGTRDVTFTIDPRSISDAVVRIAKTEYTYTGEEIKPTPIVTMDGKRMTPGTDYEVSYANNAGEGTATLTVTGIGLYGGTTVVEFTISGHYYGDWIVSKPATCTADGLRYKECSGCGDRIEETIDALGHAWSAWTSAGAETHTRTCNNCGEVEEDFHDLFCGECSVCGLNLQNLSISCDKVYTTDENIAPGAICVLAGYSEDGQSVEIYSGTWNSLNGTKFEHMDEVRDIKVFFLDDQYRPLRGFISVTRAEGPVHQAGKTVVTKAANCSEEGILTCTCSLCGTVYTEQIEKLPHTIVVDPAVAATCIETGLTAGSHCTVCGEIIEAQRVAPVLGHTWKDATCTEVKTCTVCGATEGEALGHNYVNHVCTRCGDKEYVSVDSVNLNINSLELKTGEQYTLLASVIPADASNNSVTWNSNHPEIASVNSNGRVTALYKGVAEITASVGGKTATCIVNVLKPVTSVALDITETTLSLSSDKTRVLTPTVLPGDASDKTVIWSTSNPGIATVENDSNGCGVVTAVGIGTATITAKAGDFNTTCSITVTNNNLLIEGIAKRIVAWEHPFDLYQDSIDAPYSLRFMKNITYATYKTNIPLDVSLSDGGFEMERSVDVYDVDEAMLFGGKTWDQLVLLFRMALINAGYTEDYKIDEFGEKAYTFIKYDDYFEILGQTKAQRVMNEGALIYVYHSRVIKNGDPFPPYSLPYCQMFKSNYIGYKELDDYVENNFRVGDRSVEVYDAINFQSSDLTNLCNCFKNAGYEEVRLRDSYNDYTYVYMKNQEYFVILGETEAQSLMNESFIAYIKHGAIFAR